MTAYYNEWEPFPAQWLRNLSAAGEIAPGVVDGRSITEVTANDVRDFTQCHWFAGIGVWSYALRLAGWPDDCPIWSASLPCQPWSNAGDGKGADDERHLWPTFFRLVCECRPRVIVGEQVSSADGLAWFDLVSRDLEREGYAVAAVDLCGPSVGAPHVRQRLFWMAYSVGVGLQGRLCGRQDSQWQMVDRPARRNGAALDGWGRVDWLDFKDGRKRPVKPGLKPLVNRTPGDVGQIRAYGNAIIPEVAATFIESVIETLRELGVL